MDDRVKPPILKRDAKRPPSGDISVKQAGQAQPKRSSGWALFWKLVVLAALGGAGYWIYGLATHPAATVARNGRSGGPPSSVGVATATTGTVHVYVNALGTVTPLASVTIQSQVNGQLQKVAFQEGQMVKKGDFLAQIDPRPYEALKAQYEGQLARDVGLLEQARSDNIRYQTLLQQNSIARQQAENQVFVVAQDEGTVSIDRALIEAQALNIQYCRIVAPIDGRVGLRLVDEGNYVQSASSTGLAVITQLQPISVLFPVPEDDLAEIAPQVIAGTKLQAAVYDRSNVKQLDTGTVSTLDNQIDTTTGTVKLRAIFGNADNKLFPNQFVNVRLLVKTIDNAVTIPSAAVQRGAPGAYTYVLGDDDKVSVRTLTLGPTEGDTVSVTKGLSAGDRVVVDGADRLRDGATVSISALDGKPVAGRGGPPGSGGTQTLQRSGTDQSGPGTGAAKPDNAAQPADPNKPGRDPSKRRNHSDTQGGQANGDAK